MESKIVVDTNVIIDHFKGKSKALLEVLSKKINVVVPTLVVFEFFSGLELENPKVYEAAQKLFSTFEIQPLTEPIAKLAAETNRKNNLFKKVGAADLLIAATAIYLDLPLLTLNKKHFKLIKGVKLL